MLSLTSIRLGFLAKPHAASPLLAGIAAVTESAVEVRVVAVLRDGAANKAVVVLLRDVFDARRQRLDMQILRGLRARDKVVGVDGAGAEARTWAREGLGGWVMVRLREAVMGMCKLEGSDDTNDNHV